MRNLIEEELNSNQSNHFQQIEEINSLLSFLPPIINFSADDSPYSPPTQITFAQLTGSEDVVKNSENFVYRSLKCCRPKSSCEDCAICLQIIKKSNKIPILKCQHAFHYKCLSSWLKKSLSCPICRRKVG